jgi:hypothetical protein
MMLFHVHPLYKWTCVCLQLCLHCAQSLQHDPSTAWQVRANSTVSVLSAPFSVLQFPSNSASTLSVRYKLSRVGFVLMVPLLVLAVSFHGWVRLQRSCVSDPCNTLLLLLPLYRFGGHYKNTKISIGKLLEHNAPTACSGLEQCMNSSILLRGEGKRVSGVSLS